MKAQASGWLHSGGQRDHTKKLQSSPYRPLTSKLICERYAVITRGRGKLVDTWVPGVMSVRPRYTGTAYAYTVVDVDATRDRSSRELAAIKRVRVCALKQRICYQRKMSHCHSNTAVALLVLAIISNAAVSTGQCPNSCICSPYNGLVYCRDSGIPRNFPVDRLRQL